MKRRLLWLTVFLLAAVGATAGLTAEEKKTQDGLAATAEQEESTLPEPAREGGYFQRGGTDIGRGYGHAGKELGHGAAGFGRNFAKREFGEAGRSFGHGAAGFGKGVGIGTARGFKNFGLAFRNLGKKIDGAASDDEKDKQQSD